MAVASDSWRRDLALLAAQFASQSPTGTLRPHPRQQGIAMTLTEIDVVEQINLLDLGMFQRGEAHEAFRTLRRDAPVHWHPGTDELNGFWSITKYADVLFVSRHPELFSSAQGISGPGLRDPEGLPNVNTQPGGVSIITMDPPRHVKMRRLVNKGFTPRAVNAMEPLIRQITNTILDRIADRSSCDFVLEVAAQLPLAVICGLMG